VAEKSITFAGVVLSAATFPVPTALTATATSSAVVTTSSAVVVSPCSPVAATTAAANSTVVVYSAAASVEASAAMPLNPRGPTSFSFLHITRYSLTKGDRLY